MTSGAAKVWLTLNRPSELTMVERALPDMMNLMWVQGEPAAIDFFAVEIFQEVEFGHSDSFGHAFMSDASEQRQSHEYFKHAVHDDSFYIFNAWWTIKFIGFVRLI